jgi:hypothetical protein
VNYFIFLTLCLKYTRNLLFSIFVELLVSIAVADEIRAGFVGKPVGISSLSEKSIFYIKSAEATKQDRTSLVDVESLVEKVLARLLAGRG